MKVIAAMTLSVLVAFGAFGQGEGESAASHGDQYTHSFLPVCFNMNGEGWSIRANHNADAAADDVCFAHIEGYERYTPGDGSWRYDELDGFVRQWRVAVVQYLPKGSTGRAMKVEIVRWHLLPLDSRTKVGFTETLVSATLADWPVPESGIVRLADLQQWKTYNVLKRTDAGTLVVEDCAYYTEGATDAGYSPTVVVLGEGDDLRNVDRMVRRYLERLANPAVCTLAP